MTVLPTDTTRTLSAATPDLNSAADVGLDEFRGQFAICSPDAVPAQYARVFGGRQGTATSAAAKPMRIALVQGAISLTNEFADRLSKNGIQPVFCGTVDAVLRRIELSLNDLDVLVHPVWIRGENALDFARQVRVIRERHGALPYPQVLVLSFIEHPPVTVQWFRRSSGTHYCLFSSEENLVQHLRHIHKGIVEAQSNRRLHLRFVHSGGNPSGVGCVAGETLIRACGSFLPGQEGEVRESKSILRFINLLADSRWRFRNPRELLDLMIRHPLYQQENSVPEVISAGSVKTYILRADRALCNLWSLVGNIGDPPTLIAKESRGNKEVAYRLFCTAEVDHI